MKLPVVSGAEACRVFEQHGYARLRQRGSHIRLGHPRPLAGMALAKIVGRQEARFIAIAMDLAEIKGRTDRLRTELDRHAIEAPALVPLDRLAEMQRNQVDLDISLRAVLNRMGLEKPTPPA